MFPQGDLVYGMENEGLLLRSFLKVFRRKISWGVPLLLRIRNALGDPFPRKRLLGCRTYSGRANLLRACPYAQTYWVHRKSSPQNNGLTLPGGRCWWEWDSVLRKYCLEAHGLAQHIKHLFLKTQGFEFTSPEPI